MNEDDLKRQIKFLEDKIKDLTVEIPKCLICHEPVECPVTINSYVSTSYVSTNYKNFKKCKHSINNHTCYKCIKKYLNSTTDSIFTKCLANCCKVHKDSLFSFGEIGRSLDDLPEPTLWKSLGKNGITKCRDCKMQFDTVYDLGKHIVKECNFRLVKCHSCHKDIQFNLMNSHNETCFLKCKFCDQKLTYDDTFKFKPHFCQKKPVLKCKCNTLLSFDDIKNNKHINCTKINSYEGINMEDNELTATSRLLTSNIYRPLPLSYTSSIIRPINNNLISSRVTNRINVTPINNNRYSGGHILPESNFLSTSNLTTSNLTTESFNDSMYDDLLSEPILNDFNNDNDDNENN